MEQISAFRDRADAGRALAAALDRFKPAHPLVLALPRGGVPVAYEVAKHLAAPLDVLLVRKIGVEGHEELALGALVEGARRELVLNDDVVAAAEPRKGYIEAEVERQGLEIERRRGLYRGTGAPLDVAGRTVLVVDDGIATGATVKAALRALKRQTPARLILAVPVAPAATLAALREECDDVVCLATPEPFHAVGLHYRHFEQTTDEEVIDLLARSRTATPPARPGKGMSVQASAQRP